jgi:hypothetical protein
MEKIRDRLKQNKPRDIKDDLKTRVDTPLPEKPLFDEIKFYKDDIIKIH